MRGIWSSFLALRIASLLLSIHFLSIQRFRSRKINETNRAEAEVKKKGQIEKKKVGGRKRRCSWMDEWTKDGDREEKKMLLDKATTRAGLQSRAAKQPVLNREHRLFSGMQARAKEFCCCYWDLALCSKGEKGELNEQKAVNKHGN